MTMFAAVVVARFLTEDPADGVLLLLCVPIAVLAVVLGTWGGLLGAGLAVLTFGLWDLLEGAEVTVLGYVTRAVAFFLLGGLVGRLATLVGRTQGGRAMTLSGQLRDERERADRAEATAETLAQMVVRERRR